MMFDGKAGAWDAALWLGLAIASVASTSPAHAREGRARVDIPSQALSTMLTQIGRQTGTDIVFASADVSGQWAPAVRGAYTPQEALDIALRSTALSARRTLQGAYLIAPR